MVPIGSGRKEQPYAFCPVLGRYKTEQRCGYCLFLPRPAGNPATICWRYFWGKEIKKQKIKDKKGKNSRAYCMGTAVLYDDNGPANVAKPMTNTTSSKSAIIRSAGTTSTTIARSWERL